MSLYAAGALAEAAGVSYRQIDHWTRQGYLKPLNVEGRADSGSGNHRIYNEPELEIARLLGLLSDGEQRVTIVRRLVETGQSGPLRYEPAEATA